MRLTAFYYLIIFISIPSLSKVSNSRNIHFDVHHNIINPDSIPQMKKTGAFKNDSIKIEMLGKGNRVIINGEIIEDNSLVKKELGVEGEIVQKGEGNQVKLESFSGKSDTSSNSVTIIQKGKGNKVNINNQ